MSNQNIKSAGEVVSDFLSSLSERPDLDPETVSAIKALRTDGKLTRTALLRKLESLRIDADSPPEETEPHD